MAWETEQLHLDPLRCGPGVRAVFEESRRGQYYVALENDRITGSLLITSEWSDWRNGDVWWIQSVYVMPEARGRGVFKHLFQHVKSLSEARSDIFGLRLYVDKRNGRAKQVYEQLGMNSNHYEVCEWMKDF